MDTESHDRDLGSRAPRFVRASRLLHLSWQAGIFLIGLAVVGVGVAMLALPGPGWLVIFAGVALWATEFVWAQLVLHWTRRKVAEAAAKAMDPKVRHRNLVLTVTGVLIASILVWIYLAHYGMVPPWTAAK